MPRFPHPCHAALLVLAATAAFAVPASALQVWSGRTQSFSKANFADWTQAQNQDRITPGVWITRQNNQGLFNIATEPSYTAQSSPAGTRWATGNAADHASLTFLSWEDWAGGFPPGTVGVDAVLHLVAEDIYLDIRVTSWTERLGGGGFSYVRAVDPTLSAPLPGRAAFALRGFATNPFAGAAAIEFSLPDGSPATLEVFDVSGRALARLDVGPLGAGAHRIDLPQLRDAAPGLLFARLARAGEVRTARGARIR